jgi:hypothetical protein
MALKIQLVASTASLRDVAAEAMFLADALGMAEHKVSVGSDASLFRLSAAIQRHAELSLP